MQKIKFKVFSVSATDGSIQFVGYEQLNEDGNWEYKREGRDTYLLGTISGNQGNITFIREQYIGTKDKTGAEVFSGDILNEKDSEISTCKNRMYRVKYKSSGFGDMYGLCLESLGKYPCNSRKFIHHVESDCEVIGNIHQNKELLS